MPQPKTQIVAIKALNDNYIWAIVNFSTKSVALVDPGDAVPCIAYIEEHQLQLVAILITHHHIDHVGGLDDLRQYCQQQGQKSLTVYGPAFQPLLNGENLPIPRKYNKHTDVIVTEKSILTLPALDCTLTVMLIPGHTLEHIAYYNDAMIFCGDTLFSGGCGRIFEGTHEQMFHSLNKIAKLPPSTKVYCSHEYTQANLKFAIAADPDNSALKCYIDTVKALRNKAKLTLPSTIALELEINPFLRSHQPALAQTASAHTNQILSSPNSVFSALRNWKDTF